MVAGVAFPVIEIVDVHEVDLLHCVDDGLQILPSAWHILEDNPIFDWLAFKERVTHRQRVQQPFLNASALQVIHIGNVVTVRRGLFAFDREAEGVEDIPLPFVESALQHLLATAQVLIIHPEAIQLVKGNLSGTVDGFHNPYEFIGLI